MYSIWQWNSNIRRQSSTIVRFQASSSKEPLLPSPRGGLIALACFLFPPNHSLDSRLDLAPHQTTLQILDSIWRQISDIGRWNSAIVRVRASLNENPLFPSPRGRGGGSLELYSNLISKFSAVHATDYSDVVRWWSQCQYGRHQNRSSSVRSRMSIDDDLLKKAPNLSSRIESKIELNYIDRTSHTPHYGKIPGAINIK